MMRLDCAFLPELVDKQRLPRQVAVIIDVLRASTTIITAITNGCRWVYPVASISNALRQKRSLHHLNPLLAGERKGEKIRGFDLGNSPGEFLKPIVSHRPIIITTTNGTKAIVSARTARLVMIGAFVNLTAVANLLQNFIEVILICSGQDKKIACEDIVAAGAIIDRLLNLHKELILTDSAQIAHLTYLQAANDLVCFLKKCEHGRGLIELGFEHDIELAGQIDTSSVVPVLNLPDNRLTPYRKKY